MTRALAKSLANSKKAADGKNKLEKKWQAWTRMQMRVEKLTLLPQVIHVQSVWKPWPWQGPALPGLVGPRDSSMKVWPCQSLMFNVWCLKIRVALVETELPETFTLHAAVATMSC